MSKQYHQFLKDSADKAFDQKHRATIKFNMQRYDAAVAAGRLRYANIDEAKERAAWFKREALRNWEESLLKFERNIQANGAEVLWATTAKEATELVQQVLKDEEAKLLVKSKSMTTEEVDFNEAAEAIGVESVETDLGEFIVQVAGEKPYHIVTPAMHKSRFDIADLFHEKFGTSEDATPEELTLYVRDLLREKFIDAEVGVTGANFLVADIGGVAVTENEGNALMSTALPRVHIVLAGIEKVIPNMEALGTLWPILSAHGTGQQVTVYNSIFTGPKKQNEVDGPERMVVILMDNGRTNLHKSEAQKEALSCIRCGACLNACPVYKVVGGYTYDATYSGPIGSVITPFFKGFKGYGHLSYACSLCGKCKEVCPVKIDLPELLLENRKEKVEKHPDSTERLMMKGVSFVLGSRRWMDFLPSGIKNSAMNYGAAKVWGPRKELPQIAKASFSSQMKKKGY